MNSPKHVAIIMDGNGRWGLKKKNSRNYGHKKGLETVEEIISAAIKKKLNFLHYMFFQQKIGNVLLKKLIIYLNFCKII